ncbi:MAG: hypothetical protein ABR499_16200 [Gemmatimonadaceae bacterium]
MEFDDLLSIIAKDDRRQEFAALGERLNALRPSGATRSPAADAQRRALLDEMRHQLRLHLRAARHPIPTDDELEAMVGRHFDGT